MMDLVGTTRSWSIRGPQALLCSAQACLVPRIPSANPLTFDQPSSPARRQGVLCTWLPGCTNAVKLVLANNRISDEGIQAFALAISAPGMLGKLKQLQLHGNAGITERSIEPLARALREGALPELRRLTVNTSLVGLDNTSPLVDACRARPNAIDVVKCAKLGLRTEDPSCFASHSIALKLFLVESLVRPDDFADNPWDVEEEFDHVAVKYATPQPGSDVSA